MSQIPLLSPGQPLHLQTLSALEGVLWIQRGFYLFKQYPYRFTGLFCAGALIMMIASLIPFVGIVLANMAYPWLILVMMHASQNVLRGQPPSLAVMAEPLRWAPSRVRPLLIASMVYLLTVLLLTTLPDWLDGGAWAELMQSPSDNTEDMEKKLLEKGLLEGLLLRLGLSNLLMILFWHVPPLVYWGEQHVGRALVFNLLALWRNKLAFLVFVAVWVCIGLALALGIGLLFASLNPGPLLPVVLMPFFSMYFTVYSIANYFSFAGCFRPHDKSNATA